MFLDQQRLWLWSAIHPPLASPISAVFPSLFQLHVLENATSNTGKTSTELKTFSSNFFQICRLYKNHISWATGIGLALAVNMAGPGPSLAFFSIHTRFLGEPTWSVALNIHCRNSLVVQWLRLCAPNAGGLGSIPGQGTRSHTLQERSKILRAETKSMHAASKGPTRCSKGPTCCSEDRKSCILQSRPVSSLLP